MYFFDCGSCMVPAQKTHILQSYFIKTPSVTPLLAFKDLFVVRNTILFTQRVINMHRILAKPLNRSKNLVFQKYYTAIYRYPAEAYKYKVTDIPFWYSRKRQICVLLFVEYYTSAFLNLLVTSAKGVSPKINSATVGISKKSIFL